MNQHYPPHSASDGHGPSTDSNVPVPDTSMRPDVDKVPPAIAGRIDVDAPSGHGTRERTADSPASAGTATLQATCDQWRAMRDEWAESARTTVRNHPLASLAAALTLGIVVARIAR